MLRHYVQQILTQRRRRQYASQTNHPEMQDYLASPMVDPKTSYRKLEYLVVDLEMSGLDASRDQILSIGFVVVKHQQILLETAQHLLVQHENINLEATAPIHNIRNIDLLAGGTLEQCLIRLLENMRSRVTVVHHAPLDIAFLNQASEQCFGVPLHCQVLDTLRLEQNRHSLSTDSVSADHYRLHACRERYNLPPATAHNALTDAIATAELWLAQSSHIARDSELPLSYFLK